MTEVIQMNNVERIAREFNGEGVELIALRVVQLHCTDENGGLTYEVKAITKEDDWYLGGEYELKVYPDGTIAYREGCNLAPPSIITESYTEVLGWF